MWIEPYGDKFKYIERYKDTKTGKTRRVSTILNSDSKQAQNKARLILAKKIDEKQNAPKSAGYTFGDMFDLFFEYKSKSWANGSKYLFATCYRLHIQSAGLNEYLLDQITLSDVQRVVDTVQYQKGRSRSLAIHIKNIIIAVYKFANKFYGIECNFNPSYIELKKERSKRKYVEFIDSHKLKDELRKIRQSMPEVYADFVEVQILTGMRFGELAALTKDDWDKENNTITINKSADISDKRKVSSTKNVYSNRVIESSERINEIIERRIKINDSVFGEKSSLIFANQNNRPQLSNYINRLLKSVDAEYTTHTMRHTHISLLAGKQLPLKYIMERVGHANPQTTLKIYNHVTEEARRKGADALNNLY